MNERPSKYLEPRLSEERLERNWQAIESRLPTARRRHGHAARLFALAAIATVVLAIAMTRFIRTTPARGAIDGAILETAAGQQQSLELGDGSQLVLGSATKLRLERVSGNEIRLRLEAGSLDASVTHVAGRPFTVTAGAVEVHVVGTKFRVELDASVGDILVGVTEGRVALTRSDGMPAPSSLGAGETWALGREPPRTEEPTASPDASAPSAAANSPVRSATPTLSRRFRDLWRDGRVGAAWAELPSAQLDAIIGTSSPQDLLAVAECARMNAHPRDAARAFDSLRKRFRTDPRAPLAAVELGRLRLNELGAPLDAKEAFEDAITLDPAGSFREDADARIVEALEAAGLTAECVERRERYLRLYPSGLHERIVTRRCR